MFLYLVLCPSVFVSGQRDKPIHEARGEAPESHGDPWGDHLELPHLLRINECRRPRLFLRLPVALPRSEGPMGCGNAVTRVRRAVYQILPHLPRGRGSGQGTSSSFHPGRTSCGSCSRSCRSSPRGGGGRSRRGGSVSDLDHHYSASPSDIHVLHEGT